VLPGAEPGTEPPLDPTPLLAPEPPGTEPLAAPDDPAPDDPAPDEPTPLLEVVPLPEAEPDPCTPLDADPLPLA
jgi:hypothetical protein